MTPPYRAVIFDMDGVLVDSEPAFFEAANTVLASEGKSIDWERYKVCLGTSAEETWTTLARLVGLTGDIGHYMRFYGKVLLETLARPQPPLPGALELLDELDRRGVPYALATSSWERWAQTVLRSAGLLERFPVRATGDAVEREKPAPDIYLLAAERLGVDPRACVAVEDTPPGLASARAAGMYAVQVRASSTAFPPLDGAHLVIDTLRDFPLGLVGE